jgi:hypothetical protein
MSDDSNAEAVEERGYEAEINGVTVSYINNIKKQCFSNAVLWFLFFMFSRFACLSVCMSVYLIKFVKPP